jgi:hypothetical protein
VQSKSQPCTTVFAINASTDSYSLLLFIASNIKALLTSASMRYGGAKKLAQNYKNGVCKYRMTHCAFGIQHFYNGIVQSQ